MFVGSEFSTNVMGIFSTLRFSVNSENDEKSW